MTDEQGITHHYGDEDAAEAAWGDKVGRLEHRRGGFFVKRAASEDKRSSKRSRKGESEDEKKKKT